MFEWLKKKSRRKASDPIDVDQEIDALMKRRLATDTLVSLEKRQKQVRWVSEQMAIQHTFHWRHSHRDTGESAPEKRGMRLLYSQLTDKERQTLTMEGYVEVRGGVTGWRYRLYEYGSYNVVMFTKNNRNSLICFEPKGALCAGDKILTQKHALELRERAALGVANINNYEIMNDLDDQGIAREVPVQEFVILRPQAREEYLDIQPIQNPYANEMRALQDAMLNAATIQAQMFCDPAPFPSRTVWGRITTDS